ncbi:MAG: glycosyltransferase [Calditrichaeota bacterium]|nr:MAG: glycosyltransferase [Calditrichota bacterium]
MNSTPYFSIIVPSYNRREEIRELLDSFLSLDFPPDRFELIIADDGSTDGTAELVQQYVPRCPFSLRFVQQENRGPGAARNLGMQQARGDFFIFIDSDCTVSPRWLEAIDRAIREEQADAFGGPDSCREDFPPLLKAINYSMTSFITTGGIRGHKRTRLGKFYPRSFNMGLSRAVYEKIGGFGNLRHGQDIEYSHRILQSGARVVHVPGAVVYHKRRTSLKKFFRQVFNWGVARINLYCIDRGMLEPVHALPALATLGLILLVGGSLFLPGLRPVLAAVLLGGGAVLAGSAIHAALQYRHWRMLYLVPLVMPIQILGYGLGFLIAFVRRVMLKQGEFVGFRKRYYE